MRPARSPAAPSSDHWSGSCLGAASIIASFAAYTFEKKISKHPERFGHGAIEGVAAPESANNAAAQTAFIPLLTLGIPPNAVMALMVGAMTIHGIVPGPQVMTKQPELFWGMIASMWLGNLALVIINLPMVGIWVSLLRVPYRLLFPSIIVFCCIGIYSINNSPFDVGIAAAFGLVGYWLLKHDFEPAPMLLGFVLGPLMEENLRRAMLIARGDATVFLTRPISGVLLSIAIILLVIAAHAEDPATTRRGVRRVGTRPEFGFDITARRNVGCGARCAQIANGDGAAGRYKPAGSDLDLLIGLDWTARTDSCTERGFEAGGTAMSVRPLRPLHPVAGSRAAFGAGFAGAVARDLHRHSLDHRRRGVRSGSLLHRRQTGPGKARHHLRLEGRDLAVREPRTASFSRPDRRPTRRNTAAIAPGRCRAGIPPRAIRDIGRWSTASST